MCFVILGCIQIPKTLSIRSKIHQENRTLRPKFVEFTEIEII